MLKVAGIPLIEHHVKNLAKAGIRHIVINHAWLGSKIEDYLKDGSQFGVSIQYSREGEQALETAGGIIKAMPYLIDNQDSLEPFVVVNGDIFTSFDFSTIGDLTQSRLAKIWLVENPDHNLAGDFQLVDNKVANVSKLSENQSYTFTGIGLYRPDFFKSHSSANILALGPLLRETANEGLLEGVIIDCDWTDVGTPQRLAQLNE
jgi:MurNAc alpha-1-phosphate uridylyltransferase